MRTLIVAIGPQGLIGIKNDLPWERIPADMKFFKEHTAGKIVIMGRNTWESLPPKFRPLPNRINVVVTTQSDFNPGSLEVEVISGLDEARLQQLENKYPGKDIVFIGGAGVYKAALTLNLVDAMYITDVNCPRQDIQIEKPEDAVYFDRRWYDGKALLKENHHLTSAPYICYLEHYTLRRPTVTVHTSAV